MPWNNDIYYYTQGIVNAIVEWYCLLYDRQMIIGTYQITHLFTLVEFKADFDIALDSIGRGEWRGLTSHRFNDYRQFGRMQRVIIASILGIKDYELRAFGFNDAKQLRYEARKRMLGILNKNLGHRFTSHKNPKLNRRKFIPLDNRGA